MNKKAKNINRKNGITMKRTNFSKKRYRLSVKWKGNRFSVELKSSPPVMNSGSQKAQQSTCLKTRKKAKGEEEAEEIQPFPILVNAGKRIPALYRAC